MFLFWIIALSEARIQKQENKKTRRPTHHHTKTKSYSAGDYSGNFIGDKGPIIIGVVFGILGGGFLLIALLVCICSCRTKCKQVSNDNVPPPPPAPPGTVPPPPPPPPEYYEMQNSDDVPPEEYNPDKDNIYDQQTYANDPGYPNDENGVLQGETPEDMYLQP